MTGFRKVHWLFDQRPAHLRGAGILEDEQSIWPDYYPAPVVRDDVLEENPEVEEILNSVTETLNVDAIREMNGRVDIEGENPEDVARDYLEQQGLI